MSPRAGYEIRLSEPLENRWRKGFLDMDIVPITGPTGPGTLLRGSLPDQAALFGLLARLRDLNLTILEVRRVDDDQPASTPGASS